MIGNLNLNSNKLTNLSSGTTSGDAVNKGQLDLKRDLTAPDSKIRNSTDKTAISCDTDRYISVKSNGNKICDLLEDEVNAGFTVNTYNKRLNLVSN